MGYWRASKAATKSRTGLGSWTCRRPAGRLSSGRTRLIIIEHGPTATERMEGSDPTTADTYRATAQEWLSLGTPCTPLDARVSATSSGLFPNSASRPLVCLLICRR